MPACVPPGGCSPRLPPGEIRGSVLYDLALDSTRPRPRAVFEETRNSTRRRTRVLGLSQTCETLRLQLPVSRAAPAQPRGKGGGS